VELDKNNLWFDKHWQVEEWSLKWHMCRRRFVLQNRTAVNMSLLAVLRKHYSTSVDWKSVEPVQWRCLLSDCERV